VLLKVRKGHPLRVVHEYVLLILGVFLLAFGGACFISPLGLVTGGMLSVAVIVQHFIGSSFNVIDIVTWILQILMIGLSFIFLGKKFTLRSIFTMILYPALLSLFTRIPVGGYSGLGEYIARYFVTAEGSDWALRTLAGIAGGACIGAGVGVCYYAGGSTGGFDIISVIIARHSPIKEAASSFFIDALLVLLGIILMRDVVNGLIGVLSAFVCALAVQYIYVNSAGYVIADIISSEHEAIQKYVYETMERTTTIIEATGGYSKEGKTMLRVAMSKRELADFRSFIGKVDPRAFVTFTQASMINGEGFSPLINQRLTPTSSPVESEHKDGEQ